MIKVWGGLKGPRGRHEAALGRGKAETAMPKRHQNVLPKFISS